MTTPIPRAHAEMAARFYADISLKCWVWQCKQCWFEIAAPSWNPNGIYHVGHTAPTEPPPEPVKMCELGGLKFPMPMQEAPAIGASYWLVRATQNGRLKLEWNSDIADQWWFKWHLCQATEKGSDQQTAAMLAALAQAVEAAK